MYDRQQQRQQQTDRHTDTRWLLYSVCMWLIYSGYIWTSIIDQEQTQPTPKNVPGTKKEVPLIHPLHPCMYVCDDFFALVYYSPAHFLHPPLLASIYSSGRLRSDASSTIITTLIVVAVGKAKLKESESGGACCSLRSLALFGWRLLYEKKRPQIAPGPLLPKSSGRWGHISNIHIT